MGDDQVRGLGGPLHDEAQKVRKVHEAKSAPTVDLEETGALIPTDPSSPAPGDAETLADVVVMLRQLADIWRNSKVRDLDSEHKRRQRIEEAEDMARRLTAIDQRQSAESRRLAGFKDAYDHINGGRRARPGGVPGVRRHGREAALKTGRLTMRTIDLGTGTTITSPYFNLTEAAAYLRCTEDTLLAATASRDVAYIQLLGVSHIIFAKDALDAFARDAEVPDRFSRDDDREARE